MRALITGATGFLGSALGDTLSNQGDFVVGLIHDDKWVPDALEWDVYAHGQLEACERLISKYEIDTIFHLAAQVQVSTAVRDPVNTFESNIAGTWKVLEACRRQKVNRIIVASTDKVYGDGKSPYFETQEIRPHGIYATSKACADLAAQSYSLEYALPIAITRCGNLFGPRHLNYSTLIPGTIRSILAGERPILRSNGGPKRDYLFVADAVEGYIKLAESEEVGVFNFGTGQGRSVLEVVKAISLLMNYDGEPVIKNDAQAVEIETQVLDSRKAEIALDWKPNHTFEAGLQKTIDWYRDYL